MFLQDIRGWQTVAYHNVSSIASMTCAFSYYKSFRYAHYRYPVIVCAVTQRPRALTNYTINYYSIIVCIQWHVIKRNYSLAGPPSSLTFESRGVSPIVFWHPSVRQVVVSAERIFVQYAVGPQVGEHAAGYSAHPGDTWKHGGVT